MKNLYNKLNKFNVNMELVDDIYYKGNFIDGIVIYFPNGETFQVFKDEDNKYRFINENLAVILISDDVNETIEKIVGGQREIKIEIEDWMTEITTREIINKLENKLIESFGDMIEIK